jgi:hypothetical protein
MITQEEAILMKKILAEDKIRHERILKMVEDTRTLLPNNPQMEECMKEILRIEDRIQETTDSIRPIFQQEINELAYEKAKDTIKKI